MYVQSRSLIDASSQPADPDFERRDRVPAQYRGRVPRGRRQRPRPHARGRVQGHLLITGSVLIFGAQITPLQVLGASFSVLCRVF